MVLSTANSTWPVILTGAKYRAGYFENLAGPDPISCTLAVCTVPASEGWFSFLSLG